MLRVRLHAPLRTIVDAAARRDPRRVRRIIGLIAARCGYARLPENVWLRIAETILTGSAA